MSWPKPEYVPEELMKETVALREKGLLYNEIMSITGLTYKRIESIILRNKVDGMYSRAFNFPEIIHSPRFGAK
tara:strand:- start:5712 stop:5930 length:219 start_codon:yes stop_codon:yes gene_type:complete